ncbi:hypothetical protein BJD55_gp140 [Gordonia phage Yvonnetastic]|uniref:Uncharacterized protein n=1 Tax=Gordonia phage Yvonnetastic TaxID=1821566 RepID=A0A142K943_9CAUD|nr:hypothetical protein BJD55_gp140 [Gordonia phage Yvonnetastic]AMS02626.1 hypothetical protein SEA_YVONNETASTIC_82 [Gordonia phage Yvonnetastic]WKW86058.1 hypothetical protein SEA_JONJAMES_84 [Gordonia Phage JonJames]
MSEVDHLREEVAKLRRHADRLALTLDLVLHDAHPVYANTSGWRGGIGGSALTPGCSIIDPPPDSDWTQYDLPSKPLREYLAEYGVSAKDWARGKAIIKHELEGELK